MITPHDFKKIEEIPEDMEPSITFENDFYTVTVYYIGEFKKAKFSIDCVPKKGNLRLYVADGLVLVMDPALQMIQTKDIPKITERLQTAMKSSEKLQELITILEKERQDS